MKVRFGQALIAGSRVAVLGAGVLVAGCEDRVGEGRGADTIAVGDTAIIDGVTPSCARCSFDVARVATIGSRTDAEIPQRVPDVLRDSRGNHYLVFHGWVNKPILRYDSTGQFLGKLGAYGQGPGEYRMTFSAFVGPGDSVYVWAERRLQLFAPGGAYVRAIRVPRGTPFGLGPAGEGTVYSRLFGPLPRKPAGSVLGGTTREVFVVISDSAGVVRDSFPIFSLNLLNEARPVVAPDGSVWTHTGMNYRLEHHRRTGETEQLLGVVTNPNTPPPIMTRQQADSIFANSIRADPSGSASRQSRPPTTPPRARPRTRIEMLVDSVGLLWIARTIPAPGWDTLTITPQYLSPDEAPEEATIPREQEDRMHHTIIEIIDPRRAQLLARTELPFLGMLARPGFVARVTADEDGVYRTEVYRVTLRGAR